MLRVVHDFTSDASSLVRAVSNLRGNSSLAVAAEDEGARLEAELADLLAEERLEEAGGKAMREHYLGIRAEDTINALESIGRYLSGVQSRKNVIWVSSGFPLVAFDYRGRSPTREINRATRSLNDGNVALYTVDARGLIPAFSGVPGKLVPTTLSMVQLNQDILHSVSEQTGGRAFINTNDIQGAIRRASDDARMTYVLGYYPTDDGWDGRFHRIEVKVNRPRLQVRHRQGYFAVATEKQASSQRSAAHQRRGREPDQRERPRSDAASRSRRRQALGLSPDDPRSARRDRARTARRRVARRHRRHRRAGPRRQRRGPEPREAGGHHRLRRPPAAVSCAMACSLDHTFTLVPSADRLRVVVRDARTGAIGAIGVSRQQLEAIVP